MYCLSTLAFYIDSLTNGIELTIFEPVEYFYVKDIIHDENEWVLFYSLLLALPILTSLISSLIISWFLKKNQHFRETVFCLTSVSCIGYSLYVTGLPSLVVPGKMLIGLGRSTNVITVMYFNMFYTGDELADKMGIHTTVSTAGSICGPLLTFIFLYVDTNIGALRITYRNMAAIFIFLLKSCLLPLCLFISNTSNGNSLCSCLFTKGYSPVSSKTEPSSEHSRKLRDRFIEYEEPNKHADESVNLLRLGADDANIERSIEHSLTKKRNEMSINIALSKLWRNDIKYVLMIIMYFNMVFKAINSIIPIESSKYLHWEASSIAGISLVNILIGTILSTLLIVSLEAFSYHYILFSGLLMSIVATFLLVLIPSLELGSTSIVVCVMSFTNVASSCLIGVSSIHLAEKVTIPTLVSLTNGIRVICSEVSFFFGALLTWVVHQNLETSGYVGVSISFVLCIMLLIIWKKVSYHTI